MPYYHPYHAYLACCLGSPIIRTSQEADPAGTGVLRGPEFNKALAAAASAPHQPPVLSAFELLHVRRHLGRDAFGRVEYACFPQLLEKTRFLTLKRGLIETRGDSLVRALLEECKRIEKVGPPGRVWVCGCGEGEGEAKGLGEGVAKGELCGVGEGGG